jgi:hypothetical protein
MVSAYFTTSLVQMLLFDQGTSRNIVGMLQEWSSANVSAARNEIVRRFLEHHTAAEWLLFIDSDMQWDHDALDRLTNVNSRFVNQSYRYDASGNRTNYSVEMSFAVAPLANRKIASDATLSVPLATTGDLLIPFARWTIRSSNRELVPKSGLQVVDEGTTAPTLRITPAPGEVGTTRITVIAINAG